jgi:hypothetical protein
MKDLMRNYNVAVKDANYFSTLISEKYPDF